MNNVESSMTDKVAHEECRHSEHAPVLVVPFVHLSKDSAVH